MVLKLSLKLGSILLSKFLNFKVAICNKTGFQYHLFTAIMVASLKHYKWEYGRIYGTLLKNIRQAVNLKQIQYIEIPKWLYITQL